MDRFIPNVPGCSKYHISKDGELYSIFSGTWKVVTCNKVKWVCT